MPLACNLGLDGRLTELRLAAIQNVNGQALTLAKKHLGLEDARDMRGFTFGVPYRFSMHYYLLCHYLASQGVSPLDDVTIVEVPPPAMPYYLEQGWVDGILAPEPFNQLAANQGTGFIHLLSKEIWDGHPCCGIATTRSFAARHPHTYDALRRGVLEAQLALHRADPEQRRAMARDISGPAYLDLDDPLCAEQVLSGEFPDGKGNHLRVADRIDFVPHPQVEHGTWILSQMQRWGQLATRVDHRAVAEDTFDSDTTRALAEAVGYSAGRRPGTDRLGFDGRDPFAYMAGQPFCAFEEDALARSRREIEIRNRVAQVFLTSTGDELYLRILDILLEAFQSPHGVFGYLDEAGDLVVPTMTRRIWDQCQVPDKDIVFPRETWGDSIWPRAIREKKILWSNERSTRTPPGHVPVDRNIAAPIVHQGAVIGVVQVANKETDYDDHDLALMQTLVDRIAPILHGRLQHERDEARRRQDAEALRQHRDHLEELVDERTRALQQSHAYLRHLLDSAPAVIYACVLRQPRSLHASGSLGDVLKGRLRRCLWSPRLGTHRGSCQGHHSG